MKNQILNTLILLFLFTTHSFSQGPISREFGIRSSSFQDFGFIYKKETKPNTLWRFRMAYSTFQFNYNGLVEQGQSSVKMGFAIGREKRKALNDKFYFYRGLDTELQFSSSSAGSSLILYPRIGYVLGFQYNITNDFYVSLETIPGLSVSYDFENDYTTADLGFNQNAAALTVAYRFKNKNE